jgi:putative inorganic carbon (hco3(-)) transporter
MSLPNARAPSRRGLWIGLALLLAALGIGQIVLARQQAQPALPTLAAQPRGSQALAAGAFAMDSPAFHFSPGWSAGPQGADPAEPANPEITPSGSVTFTWTGRDLALLLAPGDYRGHIHVTVDGQPANLLPSARSHQPPVSPSAGYKPLYAPEMATAEGPGTKWFLVHSATQPGLHTASLEVWRSWGQTPLRGVAIDVPLPQQPATWPGVAMLIAAVWCATPLWLWLLRWMQGLLKRSPPALQRLCSRALGLRPTRLATWLALVVVVVMAASLWLGLWWLCATALILLGLAGVVRPALWYGALLFALPFYFRFSLPLLPGRMVNLVDTGVYLGLAIVLFHAGMVAISGRAGRTRFGRWPLILLALIASWALVAAVAAQYQALALREWRTVFLMGMALAAGLALGLHVAQQPRREITLLVGAWLAGAATLAAAALLLYPRADVIVPAEGVARLRAFYGSPNNLALYLERTMAVSLALALFARAGRVRATALLLALPQAAALLLTFSRGALFVALPALIASLWVLGFLMLRHQQRPLRILWWLAALFLLAALAMVPFLGTVRFRNVASLASGTGFLRVNLWRSAWQMALDHPLLGVGPDNFLYAYRSGYILPQAWMEPNLNHPHNWLLDWWTRIGIPGLVLGISFWLSTASGLLRKVLGAGRLSALAVGALAATITALAHGLLDVSYALPDLMAVWALFAVLAAVEPDTTVHAH